MPVLALRVVRVVGAIAWLLLGVVVGVCAAVLSSWWWGLVLGAGATVALAVAAPAGWAARVPLALGWALVVLRLALRRPEGDYVVGGDLGGYALLVLGLALVVAALVTVPVRRTHRPSEGPGGAGESAPAPPLS